MAYKKEKSTKPGSCEPAVALIWTFMNSLAKVIGRGSP